MTYLAGLLLIGLLTGLLAASLGIGGGVIFVPALVVLYGIDQHTAQGTSLAVIVPSAFVATVTYTRRGRVSWRVAVPLAIAGIVGAFVGSRFALALDGDLLRRMFAVLLAVLGARMLLRARRLRRATTDRGSHPPVGEELT